VLGAIKCKLMCTKTLCFNTFMSLLINDAITNLQFANVDICFTKFSTYILIFLFACFSHIWRARNITWHKPWSIYKF
jgi:hypothetical protein